MAACLAACLLPIVPANLCPDIPSNSVGSVTCAGLAGAGKGLPSKVSGSVLGGLGNKSAKLWPGVGSIVSGSSTAGLGAAGVEALGTLGFNFLFGHLFCYSSINILLFFCCWWWSI